MASRDSRITVIICAYADDRWGNLLAAIASVQAQTLMPSELVVVVDHNPCLFKRLRDTVPDIVVVENSGSRGLSAARNTGISVATGNIIAFIDDDAEATPGWLTQLLVGYHDPQVVGVGGAIEAIWAQGKPTWFPEEFNWVVGCTYQGMPRSVATVRNLIGCNMSFRREAFRAAGEFQVGIGRVGNHPVGCEETEFCIRVSYRLPDSLLVYLPQARVKHHVPEARAGGRYFRSRCYAEGLSKALVTQLVGPRNGLAAETAYAVSTLPGAVLRGVADSLFRRDMHGISRALVIIGGLAITSAGYIAGTWSRMRNPWHVGSANSGVLVKAGSSDQMSPGD